MSVPFSKINSFKAPGPVAAAYIADRQSMVKAILGPVGGGKTTANIFDSISAASRMPPCNDGIIRYRRAIIGTTYGQLERNLYPSWKRWLPEDGGDFTPVAEWKGGGGRSASHKLKWSAIDLRTSTRRVVEAEYIFAAIGDAAVEEFMRGFEPTDLWLFEMDQLVEAVLDVGITRIGRYPPSGDDPDAVPLHVPFHHYVCGDLNAPDIDSWFYRTFEEGREGLLDADGMPMEALMVDGKPVELKVYKQPSGRSPRAENIKHLRPGYYDRQIAILSRKANGKHLIKRMVDAQYAPSLDGVPIYQEYDDAVHLMPEIAPLPHLPVHLSFDQGLQRPAAVGFQITSKGQYRVLFECVPGRMNGRRFAEAVALKLREVAPDCHLHEHAYCDPAGTHGADREGGDIAWNEIVGRELNIVIEGTETNEIDPRLTAVKDELSYMIEPGIPGLIISKKHCPMLRKGFASHYRYKREKVGGSDRTSDKPDKTDESHPHDALQYGILGTKGRYGAIVGPRDAQSPDRLGTRRGADDSFVVVDAPVVF